jgi:osmotically-inducible protein OsmY
MTRALIRSDARIQQDVLRELKWDTRVEETDVGVEVDGGIVTLTGFVSSHAKRVAAQEAAHRVSGVRDVANDVKVRVPGSGARTDAEIAHVVRNALEWDAHVPADRIQTTVSDAWVTLEGSVDYWSEREEAERTILHLAGVRGVTNMIGVSGPPIESARIRETIEEALERRAEREAKGIQVEVQAGTVTLSGYVRSWREKRAILGAVIHAPGVRDVEDNLQIDPYV